MSIIMACKKDRNPVIETIDDPNSTELLTDTLSTKHIEYLDSLQSATVLLDSMLLPNGMTIKEFREYMENNKRTNNRVQAENGPQLIKNKIIMDMLLKGYELNTRSSFVKPDESTSSNPYRPAQPNGIAYGYGNKDYSKRVNPAGPCFEEVYGLDCSGYLQQLVFNAGLTAFPSGTSDIQGSEATWNAMFEKDEKYKDLKMKDFGHLAIKDLQTGDIIVWNGHIGMIGGSGAGSFVLNSNGSAALSCLDPNSGVPDYNCIRKEQEKNRGLGRGPRIVPITDAQSNSWFGKNYRILRITTRIEGNWKILGRCTGSSYDAIDFNIVIKSDLNQNDTDIKYTVSSQGLDYDGTPYSLSIEGVYDSEKNILKGDMTFTFADDTEYRRVDRFEIALKTDDTGFHQTTKVVNNGGCDIDLRFVNLQNENLRTFVPFKNQVKSTGLLSKSI
ncbi:hypothetical protein [Dyadobacter jejuensis]|nr:hypothetical protein [Dyadobacter jejuensis]